MITCLKCQAEIPEELRFCLQCGASLEPQSRPVASLPAAPVATLPQPPRKGAPRDTLNMGSTGLMVPRAGAAGQHPRPSLGDQRVEVDEESFKRAFERPVVQPGAVVCRFCRGPLDLAGEFCDQCGAPVAEAAPPGALKPQPQAVAPPLPPSATYTLPPSEAADPPAVSAPEQPSGGAASPPAVAVELLESVDLAPTPMPESQARGPSVQVHPSGFMGRLKRLFKKS
jgi:hypothetical protein